MIRGAWALTVFFIVTPVIAGFAFLGSCLFGRSVDLGPAILWSRCMLATLSIGVRYEGLENIYGPVPRVYVANHQSNVDIWAVTPQLPKQTKFVIKASLFTWPILGPTLRRAGYISVDRRDPDRAIESLRQAGKRIREDSPIIVFAEGTRSRDGKLAPFKKGAFHMALQADVPVVPIAISGSYEILRPGEWYVYPGQVRVQFLTPVDATPYLPNDVNGLRLAVHEKIAEALRTDSAA